jgi:hypothetical protein
MFLSAYTLNLRFYLFYFFWEGGGSSGPRLGTLWCNACEKFHNTRTTPSWRKVCGTEKKKNNPKNSGHFVPLQRLRTVHACTPLRPRVKDELGWNNTKQVCRPCTTSKDRPSADKSVPIFRHSPYRDHFTIFGPYLVSTLLTKIVVQAINIILQTCTPKNFNWGYEWSVTHE